MNRIAFLVVCFCTAVPMPAKSQETVKFQTYTPNDYIEILSGAYREKPDEISGRLFLPETSSVPVAAVVVMHGSGGVRKDTELSVAKALADAGLAAFVVNSFKGRGFSETGSDQGKLPMAATVLDGFQALLALRGRPEIDGSRIGIVGFSRGGVAALFTNQRPLQQGVISDQGGFKAHAPVYPGCSTKWDDVIPTDAPVMFLLGEKDDLTPAAKCQRYAELITGAGGKADTIIYPDVSHQFLIEGQRRDRKSANFANCDLGIRSNGEMHYPSLGISVDGDWRGFVRKVFKDCGKKGFLQGGTTVSHEKAVADITTFFLRSLD